LSCRYAAEIPIVRSSDNSIVRPFVRPNNLFSCRYATEISIVRSFDHSIVHRSFIVPIHRSSFVHSPYSSFFQIIFALPLCCRNSDRSFVRSFDRLSVRSLFLFIVHRSFIRLFTITIHHYYSSLLFTITIHRHYSPSLLFIDHPITPNFNYSSIMLSSPPKTSQTHIPVIRTPVTVIFPYSRELPIWSPIPGFSKLSTLNFEIPLNQASKLRFQ
jgi:hypothetical protein